MTQTSTADLIPLLVVAFAIGLLRNALGVQQVPPNMVLNGLAIIVSAYIMAPLVMDSYDKMKDQGFAATGAGQIGQVLEVAREPVRKFLDKHAQTREKQFFLKSAASLWPPERAKQLRADDLIVLAPAFTLSELSAAFKIGFLLYLAFVVVDLIIANVLLAMGLNQVQPTQVAIPFKLLLFVVMDGWSTLIHGLVLTYR